MLFSLAWSKGPGRGGGRGGVGGVGAAVSARVEHADNASIQARLRAAKSVFLWRDRVKMEPGSAARAKTNTGGGVNEGRSTSLKQGAF